MTNLSYFPGYANKKPDRKITAASVSGFKRLKNIRGPGPQLIQL
jgi:hypothetical protein